MLIQESQTAEEKQGYTTAVDWWSLGITVFVLLNGMYLRDLNFF